MSNQTSETFAYIEREYKDAKGRVELQRRVVEQLHMVEADAGEAEACDPSSRQTAGARAPERSGVRGWGMKTLATPANTSAPLRSRSCRPFMEPRLASKFDSTWKYYNAGRRDELSGLIIYCAG